MTTTTTPTRTYRAQSDAATKTWHLGAVELDARCVCGTLLMTPGDTRKFALRLPEAERRYEVSDDLTRVTCGACRRNRAWGEASAAAAAPPAPAPAKRTRARKPKAAAAGAGEAAPDAGAGQ